MTGDFSPAPLFASGDPASARAPVVLLPARIVEAPGGRAVDILGERAARLATDFAEAGWDIGFYGVVPTGGGVLPDLRDSARAEAARVAGARAGHAPRLMFLAFDATAENTGAASALMAASAAGTAFGQLPRCLVVAPSIWPTAAGIDSVASTSTSGTTALDAEANTEAAGLGGDSLRWDSAEINAFHQANVTAPLCLARVHHAAWRAARQAGATDSVGALERYAAEDASVVVLLDAVGLQRQVGIDRVPYAASQAGLHATLASLARAFAPGMRVTAISAPLCNRESASAADRASADAALAQALCYVAKANTITGATLQLSGLPNQMARSE